MGSSDDREVTFSGKQFTVSRGDARVQFTEDEWDGEPAYIAIGRPGLRSSVWRIWRNRSSNDVYVKSRDLPIRISLHDGTTGSPPPFRLQWDNPEQAVRFTDSRDRRIDGWEPEVEGNGAFHRGVTIWVPHGELTVEPVDELVDSRTVWLPEPPPGYAIGIHIGFLHPAVESIGVPESAVHAWLRLLPDGRALTILSALAELTPAHRQALTNLRQQDEPIDTGDGTGSRHIICGTTATGRRELHDLAWKRTK